MSKIWEVVDEETRIDAENIIERIKTGKIAKRVIPNRSEEFPDDKALESFKALVRSKEQKEIIDDFYRAKNGNE